MMFDSETRWFIRCDTCPDDEPNETVTEYTRKSVTHWARDDGWEIRHGLHRCPECIKQGRTERAS